MPVQDFAGCGQHAVRENGKHSARQTGISPGARILFCGGPRVAVIRQSPLGRAKLIFEGNQTLVVYFGPTEIDAVRTGGFAFLDELPKEKRHAAHLVKSAVRASVFVNDVGAVPQSEQSGNRSAVF